MEHIQRTLGFRFPSSGARDLVDKTAVPLERCLRSIAESHNDSLRLWLEKPKFVDDDTASTVSLSEDSHSSSSSGVSFADPLVTEVHILPLITRSEKSRMFYSDYEYQEFRREYRNGGRRKCVKFAPVPVSEVFLRPNVENKDEMYYSSEELRQFLEDFILSLGDR